jgi:hypothetical protein
MRCPLDIYAQGIIKEIGQWPSRRRVKAFPDWFVLTRLSMFAAQFSLAGNRAVADASVGYDWRWWSAQAKNRNHPIPKIFS